jgi:hypothetical protein
VDATCPGTNAYFNVIKQGWAKAINKTDFDCESNFIEKSN